MTTMLPALCLGCARRASTVSPTGAPTAVRCDAYPDGIPTDIVEGADHRRARGDEVDGLTYKPVTDEAMATFYFDAWRAFAAA